MKMSMAVIGKKGHEKLGCLFICSRCNQPIEDIEEANFAPANRDDDCPPEKRLTRELTIIADTEIFHWDCDEGGVPWVNVVDGLLSAYREIKPRVPVGC